MKIEYINDNFKDHFLIVFKDEVSSQTAWRYIVRPKNFPDSQFESQPISNLETAITQAQLTALKSHLNQQVVPMETINFL